MTAYYVKTKYNVRNKKSSGNLGRHVRWTSATRVCVSIDSRVLSLRWVALEYVRAHPSYTTQGQPAHGVGRGTLELGIVQRRVYAPA